MGVSDYLRQSTTFTVHEAEASSFYAGSNILQPYADASGMPLDQLNFLVSLITSTFIAILFRAYLCNLSVFMKHVIQLVAGVALLYFCFGRQMIYVFLQATVTYLIMRFGPKQHSHAMVFVFCFAFLSAAHIIRQIYDYGGYTLDVTLPLMMLTQRLTSLAFSVHDGFTSDINSLPMDQKFLAIESFPTPLEFYSYTFYFHGILCGPFVHYADYLSFIRGTHWTRFLNSLSEAKTEDDDGGVIGNKARPASEQAIVRVQLLDPSEADQRKAKAALPLSEAELGASATYNGLKTVGVALICGTLSVGCTPLVPIRNLTDPVWQANNSFLYKSAFILMFIFITKQRYYFAWKFSDAVNIFSGLSFSGINKNGQALWRLTDNIDIREFELGTRFAVHINAWNKTTSNWLRFMIYDRASWHPTLLTFTASALWHGFYPGYYISFLTATLFLQAVRGVRSTLRPVCELKTYSRMFYDASAFVLVRFASAYMALPFIMMTLAHSYQVYSSLYFWPHLLALLSILVLPRLRRFLPESMRTKRVYGRARVKKHEGSDKPSEGTCSPSRLNLSSDIDSGNNDSDIDPMKPKAE